MRKYIWVPWLYVMWTILLKLNEVNTERLETIPESLWHPSMTCSRKRCLKELHVVLCTDVCACTVCTYCSRDGEEAVITDEDDVKDRGGAQQVIHDQPHFAETLTQHPLASQVVWDVHRDAEGTCNMRAHTNTHCMMIQHLPSLTPMPSLSPDLTPIPYAITG